MESLILVILLACLIAASAYCSASEIAFFSLSATKTKTYRLSEDPTKRLIYSLVSHPRELLVTIFILNTLINILAQNVASNMFGEAAGWGLKVGVPLVFILLFGEIIPKYISIQNNVAVADFVAPSINFFQRLLAPIRDFAISITAPVSRILFFFLHKQENISKEELRHVLKKSEEHGVLNPDEANLVWGYLNFQDATVRELMRPREDILYYDINDPLSKLTYLLVEQQCTRIPICQQNLDNLLGIITAKQFFVQRSKINTSKDLIPLLTKPFYVPENTLAPIILRHFDEKNEELAIAVDQYGSVTGLIAYEDLVEVVVGKISDLRDLKHLYTKAGENEIIASGKLELAEFNEIFHTEIESPNNMVTIGGWLTEMLGEIPKSGTKCETHGFLFQVLAADPNRIRRIYIRKIGTH